MIPAGRLSALAAPVPDAWAAALRGAPWNPGGFINVGSYLLWSGLATALLVGGMYAAQWYGLSRMSLPFILGTAWTQSRRKAMVIGLVGDAVNGLAFALVYVLGFEALDRSGWWLGALGGVAHAFVVLTLVMSVLPYVHPRMADAIQGPTPTRWLQPPGFLALNYGRRTPLVVLATHVAYGIVLGAFYQVA